ncbi:MAG: hypothetical protein ACR2M3_05970 [Thermomicrobiales bacterium]
MHAVCCIRVRGCEWNRRRLPEAARDAETARQPTHGVHPAVLPRTAADYGDEDAHFSVGHGRNQGINQGFP